MNTHQHHIELSGPQSLVTALGLSITLVGFVTLTVASLAMLIG